MRFSLLMLLGIVALAAVNIAALRTGDWFWCRLLFTLTLTVHLAAILGAVYRRGSVRAFWIGFALFGWTYLLLANVPMFRDRRTSTLRESGQQSPQRLDPGRQCWTRHRDRRQSNLDFQFPPHHSFRVRIAIRELGWPAGCLLSSIARGDQRVRPDHAGSVPARRKVGLSYLTSSKPRSCGTLFAKHERPGEPIVLYVAIDQHACKCFTNLMKDRANGSRINNA